MKIYTGTSWSISNQELCASLGVGMMPTPVDPVDPCDIIVDVDCAADNGAFYFYRNNLPFDKNKFKKWVSSIERKMDWIALPDKPLPKRWEDSYELSKEFLGSTGMKEYFVVQDGMTFDAIHKILSECDGCFIGGSTNIGKCSGWKWKMAPHWVGYCREIGLPVHMGRCPGNIKGMFTAKKIGIDSIDTSTLIRHQKLNLITKLNNLFNEQMTIL